MSVCRIGWGPIPHRLEQGGWRGQPARWVARCLPLLLLAASAWPAFGMARSPEREVVINLPAFRLYLYENGVRIREYPIAIGSVVEKETVLGTTRIINKVVDPTYYPRDWWLREGVEPIPPGENNPVGTRWLGLDIPHYGIHGTNNPSSIGSPASAGCIRMYNHDVEELTDLVQIGTPVHIIYETILPERDPLLGEWRVRIYRDLYNRQTNRLDLLLDRLQEAGIATEQLSPAGLSALLTQASGLATPLPYPRRVKVDGEEADIDAFRIGARTYVAADSVAALVGESARWSPRWRVGVVARQTVRTGMVADGRLYAPPEDLAAALGIGWREEGDSVEFILAGAPGETESREEGEGIFLSQ